MRTHTHTSADHQVNVSREELAALIAPESLARLDAVADDYLSAHASVGVYPKP